MMSGRIRRRSSAVVLAVALIAVLFPVHSFAHYSDHSDAARAQEVMTRAEATFKAGENALARGEIDTARMLFDQAVDAVLLSGINLDENSRFKAYYRDLLDRIHKKETGPDHTEQQRKPAEVVEPSVLDELSAIEDAELAAITIEGVEIYGSYDFDFAVAPPVLQFINYFTSGRGRSTMQVGLKRSGRYREMAERIFREERVPLDLIWLAQAESVWKPNALSHAAAKGIWQFIPSTGLRYGLAQSEWVDERSHPERSTRAAARYLRFLNEYFAGDWMLAMAAYNSGEGRVAGAISRCGYADFWELYRRSLLPQETRNYVPIILAIAIVSKNQERYGFDVQPDPPIQTEPFRLPNQTDLRVVAELIGIPYESVQEMNPELRRGLSPPGSYNIRLPRGMAERFEIAYAKLPEDQRVRRVTIPANEVVATQRGKYRTRVVSYRVRSGDTLSSIARRHGITVSELASFNRMTSRSTLRRGQTLRVPTKAAAASTKKKGKSAPKSRAKSRRR